MLCSATVVAGFAVPAGATTSTAGPPGEPATSSSDGGPGSDDHGAGEGDGADGVGPDFTPTYATADCPVPLPAPVAVGVECGYVTVPAQWDDPDGGTIELAVARFAATEPSDDAPLVMLAGGPGELLVTPVLSSLALTGGLNPDLHRERDFVLVDQRGVGASRPALDCDEVFAALSGGTDPATLEDEVLAGYQACHDRLVAEGIDLGAFDTRNDVDDIDAVRDALGYEQMHLFGTSYGARLGLQVAGEHASGLASLVLSSPIPAEENFLADAGPSYDRALRAVDAACAADAACDAANPEVLATLERTVAALEIEPALVEVPDPSTGQAAQVPFGGRALAQVVYSLFYSPGGPSAIPALITSVANGDHRVLLAAGEATAITSSPLAYGMQASFLCAEEAVETAPSDQAEPETLAARLFLSYNPVIGSALERICQVWDVEPADAETFEPVTSPVPTLVVTGQFDQITPPQYGEDVARALPNSLYLEIPGVGHSPLLAVGICGFAILDDFIDDPWLVPDTSCIPAAPVFLTIEDLAGVETSTATVTAAHALVDA